MTGIPLFLSGDLHALGEGQIQRYGSLDLRQNPVVSVLAGPISTGPKAWPSAWRGTPPLTPTGIELDAGLDPLEKNGFSIIDFTEDRVEGQMFSWKLDEPEENLENQRQAVQDFIEGGGGYLGIHAAGDGSHADWDWYVREVIRAPYNQHTLNPVVPLSSVGD